MSDESRPGLPNGAQIVELWAPHIAADATEVLERIGVAARKGSEREKQGYLQLTLHTVDPEIADKDPDKYSWRAAINTLITNFAEKRKLAHAELERVLRLDVMKQKDNPDNTPQDNELVALCEAQMISLFGKVITSAEEADQILPDEAALTEQLDQAPTQDQPVVKDKLYVRKALNALLPVTTNRLEYDHMPWLRSFLGQDSQKLLEENFKVDTQEPSNQ